MNHRQPPAPCAAGDRIRLIGMAPDPCPLPPGATGVVRGCTWLGGAPMKRTPFKAKAKAPERREAKQVQYVARPREVATASVELPMAQPVPKDNRHESEPWRRAVAALPCVLCGREGQTQCAHRNEGKGMSLKTDDALTAALCVPCHSAIDQGKDFTREERRQRLDLAILLTIRALARAGKLRIVA